MRQTIAVALFFIAAGMIFMLILPSNFLGILIILLFLLISYNLYFCGKGKF
jgi:energy-coupling factor transporter transmembrane protein EcfT